MNFPIVYQCMENSKFISFLEYVFPDVCYVIKGCLVYHIFLSNIFQYFTSEMPCHLLGSFNELFVERESNGIKFLPKLVAE